MSLLQSNGYTFFQIAVTVDRTISFDSGVPQNEAPAMRSPKAFGRSFDRDTRRFPGDRERRSYGEIAYNYEQEGEEIIPQRNGVRLVRGKSSEQEKKT